MIEKGEPLSYLSFLIMVIVFGVAIFLGSTESPQITGAIISSDVAQSVTQSYCSTNSEICLTLGTIVGASLLIGLVEITRRR